MNTLNRYIILALFLLTSLSVAARNERDTLGVGTRMTFSENRGQWNPNIQYRSQMRAATLFVERDCFTIVLQHPDNPNLHHHPAQPHDKDRYRQHAYKVIFEGSSAESLQGAQKLEEYENYYIGNDSSAWAGGVNVFGEVDYHNLYPGINLKVYSASNAMKYDFVVAPHANANQIAMRYDGIDGVRMQDGNIIIHTSVVDVAELRPYAYQIVEGEEREVKVAYSLKGSEVRFQLGDYNPDLELIIDPYLYFSTYTGSTSDNWGTTATYDFYKRTYTAGVVFGTEYPTSLGAYDGVFNGNADVGIFVFSPNGNQRIYSTYLGGSNADMPHSMFVNDLSELVIFGTTGSTNFPVTANAYDISFNGGPAIQYESSAINYPSGSDIFVSRFNGSGTHLAASTFVGGTGNDGLNYKNYYNLSPTTLMLGNDSLYFNYGDGARGELITDDRSNIYVGSTTNSSDFPTTATSFRPTYSGGQDGIVFKLDYNLSHMLWSGYLGGSADDAIYSIDVDDAYNLLVCGGTCSSNFPTTQGCYNATYNGGSADGFVSKISYNGINLLYSTYFGSTAYDQCYFVRSGKHNDVFIFGQTKASGSTLIFNANYNTPNSGQFLARLMPDLSALVWSTVFGTGSGEPNISPTAFAVDICDRVYAVGWGRKFAGYYLGGQPIPWNTYGTTNMSVTSNAYQSTTDGQDFYIFSMDANASQQIYGSFFGELHTTGGGGNDHVDGGTSRFDRCATLYQSVCASCGGNDDFPTTANVWSEHNNANNCNNAVFRLNVSDDFPVADFWQPPTLCAPVFNYVFVFAGRADSVRWDYGDGTFDNGSNSQHYGLHSYTEPGIYTVRLIAYMDTGCKTSDTMIHQFQIVGDTSYWLDTVSTCPGVPVQIGLTPLLNTTYHWIQGTVSDNTISNPYVNQSGVYTMLITGNEGVCTDTVHQVAILGESDFTIAGDTVSCSLPHELEIHPVGTGTYTYEWSHTADFSDIFSYNPRIQYDLDSSAMLYIHVADNQGCEKFDSIHIRFYSVLDSLVVSDARCPNECNGSVSALLSSFAVPPFTYLCDQVPSSDPTVTGLCPGNHIFVFSDSNGCQISKPFLINSPQSPLITENVTHIDCLEMNTGAITVNVQGNSTYSFEWLDDGSVSNQRQNLPPGTYIVKITDAAQCTFYDTIEVHINANMDVNITQPANTCPEICSGKALALVTGGQAPYTYLWSNGESAGQARQLCEGWAMVVVTDGRGCHVTDSVLILTQHSFDNSSVWADDSCVFINGVTQVHTTAIPEGNYHWEPSAQVDGNTRSDPYTTPLTDSVTFQVTVTDSVGCHYTDSVKVCCISVNCGENSLFIPNAFTPNNDGKNDQLCFRSEWVTSFHIAIFSRWGELVYESDDITQCWDGRYKNNNCMPGVYTFYCKISCEANQDATFKGDITLIR